MELTEVTAKIGSLRSMTKRVVKVPLKHSLEEI